MDAVASMMAAIELDEEDSDVDGTKVKVISPSGLAADERKSAATGRSGSRCPFSGTSM